MAPRTGILPRSVRERYHRSRRPSTNGHPTGSSLSLPHLHTATTDLDPPVEVPQPAPAPAPPGPQIPDPEPVPPPKPIPPPAPIPEPEPEPPPAARRPIGRRLVGLAALLAAILACAALGLVIGSVVSSAGDKDPGTTTATPKPARPAPAPRPSTRGKLVPLAATSDYDPAGDGTEHTDLLPLATDGDPSTSWSTEDYHSSLGKAGVGMYVDPRDPAPPTRLTIKTPTPGFAVEIYGSARRRVPGTLEGWTKLGSSAHVKRTQGIPLDAAGHRFRHVLVWITALPPEGGAVKLSEVLLRA
jgi:hypothetical protein